MNAELLDQSKTYLRIFGSKIVVDKSLPKYDEERKAQEKIDTENFKVWGGMMSQPNFEEDSFVITRTGSTDEGIIGLKTSWIKKFFGIDWPKKEEKYDISIIDFFREVKLSSKKAQADYVNRVDEYIELLAKAKEMGQTALCDKIKDKIDLYKYESILHAEGKLYKVTEEQMVEFAQKTERGLRLDYLKNFTRVIPDDVIKEKKKADALKIFDNYVVLHYDPLNNGAQRTKKEKEQDRAKKSDPILFGLISESHDLYYITDWIDETCDLTLDQFVKIMDIKKKDLEIGKPKI